MAALVRAAAFVAAMSVARAVDFSVVVYNVENFFDVDGVSAYEDYAPEKYGPRHLAVKAANIASVLSRVDGGRGPGIVVLNEIELDQTPRSGIRDLKTWLEKHRGTPLAGLLAADPLPAELAGLPAEAWLSKALDDAGLGSYEIATTSERPGSYEDGRPVAVRSVILSKFPIEETRTHFTRGARAILEARILVDGHPLTVFANHWKSGAGDIESERLRMANAETLRGRIDEILAADPHADILIAGDLNSHYNQDRRYRHFRKTAINDILGSQGNELALLGGRAGLYNLWFELPSDKRGSDIFKGEWGTLMHILLTRGLYDFRGIQYADNSFAVLSLPGLNADVFGRPRRWSRGETPAGFSDHFPLYAKFRTVADGDTGRTIGLRKPSETPFGSGEPVAVNISPVDLFRNALDPAAHDLFSAELDGRVFRVEGPAWIDGRGRANIHVCGSNFVLFTPDKVLRSKIRELVRAQGKLALFGELGTFRGERQFVLHGREWLLSVPDSAPALKPEKG